MQAELEGWGLLFFFSWAAHYTPPFLLHPSRCLCKPPRSSTRSLKSAQAMAPLRSALLTRTITSPWPPQAATRRSAEAQEMGIRRFDLELGVRGWKQRQAHRYPFTPHTHSLASQSYRGSRTDHRPLPGPEDKTTSSSIAKVGEDGLGIACTGCHRSPQAGWRNPMPEGG